MTTEPIDNGQTPRWATTLEDRKRPLRRLVLPFDRLDQGWKAREAANTGAAAALVIGLNNLLVALVRSGDRHPDYWTLARSIDVSRPFLCVVAALIALMVAARLRHTASPALAVWVLVWSVCDVVLVSRWLYGSTLIGGLGPTVCVMALMGVRGTFRLRRFARDGEPKALPAPAA